MFVDLKHNISVQFSPVTQSCLTLCDPMNCSMPGLPVHHQVLELTQTHVHWVSDAIQPSHPLSSPSPPNFNLFFFFPDFNLSIIRVFSSKSAHRIRWPKYWSFRFHISPSNQHSGWSPLGWTGWISLKSKGLSRSPPTPQFESFSFSALSLLYGSTLTSIRDHCKNHSLD